MLSLTAVSHATLECGSSFRHASSTASETCGRGSEAMRDACSGQRASRERLAAQSNVRRACGVRVRAQSTLHAQGHAPRAAAAPLSPLLLHEYRRDSTARQRAARTWSQSLSGWPSLTDSDEKRKTRSSEPTLTFLAGAIVRRVCGGKRR